MSKKPYDLSARDKPTPRSAERERESSSLQLVLRRIKEQQETIDLLQAEVVQLKADLYEGNCELEKQQRINKELQDAIREHRDSFSKDMDEHDWTTEDDALWALIEEVRDE